jgi:hypothetical protein
MGDGMESSRGKKVSAVVETAFNILYLLVVFLSAAIYLFMSKGEGLFKLFSLMAFVLGFGDSFHLVPRVFASVDKSRHDYTVSLGVGKLVASITMTVFYVILWQIGAAIYEGAFVFGLTGMFYVLGIIRILLCLFPQNGWTKKDPSLGWAVARNLPFLLMGIFACALYFEGARGAVFSLPFVWPLIAASFIFYIPVVLSRKKGPHLAILMILKSRTYVALIMSGFFIV